MYLGQQQLFLDSDVDGLMEASVLPFTQSGFISKNAGDRRVKGLNFSLIFMGIHQNPMFFHMDLLFQNNLSIMKTVDYFLTWWARETKVLNYHNAVMKYKTAKKIVQDQSSIIN